VFDLSSVTFIDSSGLRALKAARAESAGGAFTVLGTLPVVVYRLSS
jgi:anti-anti-sigma regulatory factor